MLCLFVGMYMLFYYKLFPFFLSRFAMFVIGLHSLATIVVIMYKYNYTIKKRKLNSHIDIFTKMFGQTCSTYTVFIQLNANLCINDLV